MDSIYNLQEPVRVRLLGSLLLTKESGEFWETMGGKSFLIISKSSLSSFSTLKLSTSRKFFCRRYVCLATITWSWCLWLHVSSLKYVWCCHTFYQGSRRDWGWGSSTRYQARKHKLNPKNAGVSDRIIVLIKQPISSPYYFKRKISSPEGQNT